jgi:hypothetical protein
MSNYVFKTREIRIIKTLADLKAVSKDVKSEVFLYVSLSNNEMELRGMNSRNYELDRSGVFESVFSLLKASVSNNMSGFCIHIEE